MCVLAVFHSSVLTVTPNVGKFDSKFTVLSPRIPLYLPLLSFSGITELFLLHVCSHVSESGHQCSITIIVVIQTFVLERAFL